MAGNDWYPDPSGRHELRWWADGAWSPSVADQGAVSDDPPLQTYPDPVSVETAPTLAQDAEATISWSALGGTSPVGEPLGGAPPVGEPLGGASAFGASPVGEPLGGASAFGPPPVGNPLGGTPPVGAAFDGAPPVAPQPAWPQATPQAVGAKIPAMERLRTGVPGPVAWAAAFLATPGVSLTLYGLAALLLAGTIEDLNNDFGGGDDFGSDFGDDASSSVAGVGVFLLAVGGFYFATAVSLMMLIPWARIAGIVIGILHALVSLAVMSASTEVGLVFLLLAGGQVWLLFTPTAQQAFKTRPVRLTEVEQPVHA